MKKLVAWELSPECCDGSVYFDFKYEAEELESMAIFGNGRYFGYKGDTFERAERALNSGELYAVISDKTMNVEEKIDNLEYIIPCKKQGGYTVADLNGLDDCLNRLGKRGERDEVILADILSIVYGWEWVYRELRGCCQGDWNGGYFDTRYFTNDEIRYIESCYFNTGTEYSIQIMDGEEEVESFFTYVTEWLELDGLKQKFKEECGSEIGEVEVHVFKGYKEESLYEVV